MSVQRRYKQITSRSRGENASLRFSEGQYGSEFDASAKDRMIFGSNFLASKLKDYASEIQGPCIEFGPFLNPLLTPQMFPAAKLTYVDGDEGVISQLADRYSKCSEVSVFSCNLSNASEQTVLAIRNHLRKKIGIESANCFLASQILNYLDYQKFFELISSLAVPGALLFINNAIEYGISELFSDKRPQSNDHVIQSIVSCKWKIEAVETINSTFVEQKNDRLIFVARKSD